MNPEKQIIGSADNIHRKVGTISELKSNGDVELTSGEVLKNIDIVCLCTGYISTLKFLNVPQLKEEGPKISPLYQHLFFTHDPTLCIIGVPSIILPFPLMQLQARWVAQVLAGHPRAALPSSEGMW